MVKAAELFRSLLGRDGRLRLIVALGLLGMALVFLSQLFPEGKEPDPATAQFTSGEYRDALEAELEELCAGIQGVGRARVMVTLANGFEYRYAKEEKRSSDVTPDGRREQREESYLLVDDGGERRPIRETEREPRVQGVVIVCDGAEDAEVRLTLTTAVITALDIPSTKVFIARIANEEKEEPS